MGSELYPKKLLQNVATLIMGQSPPGSTYNESGEGIPFYQGVRDFGERYPTRRVYCTAPTRFAETGDILFSVRAPIGEVNRATEYCAIGRGLAAMRANSGFDTTYLEYVLRHIRSEWDILEGQGAVFGNAKKSDLENLLIPWPRDIEQRAIAHILGSLDDKIELNRQMNRTLEKMAQAIFKSWFIDFDPVRAKAEGRDPGLPKEIASLFPDSFEDSELGPIPKGWKIGTISDLAKVTSGKRPHKRSKEKMGEFTIPLYGGGGIMAYVPVPMISTPFLLTGRVGTLGKVFRITEECWPSDNTLLLFPNNKSCLEFLYFTLQRIDFDSLNRGSTQPLVTQTDLKNQRIVIPKENILIFYWQNAHPMFEKIDKNIAESRALASLRDTLLPKLISGELRVPDAEKFIEEAGV